ncbi:MAG: YbaB/EbfC family nucleoid-associated protein [Saprospiraceae bacterium]|nr:YbaB/EbfC family nucleoid-associated protein [Saprospiraceae bacterium]MCB9324563.1 YbaB/EbfC family nucleoid-associated protein [Lewinellaceae bacterium]
MFGDLMGDMQEKQNAMRKKLEGIRIDAQAGDGAVKVTVTAARQLVNVSLDPTIVDPEDVEQLEDFLVVAVNKAMELAVQKETEITQELLRDMLPPGLDGLDGLF